MKRNSNTIYFVSPGSTTPLPWLGTEPDFSAITEPTLSVFVSTWTAFLASGQELEIVDDPVIVEPVPEPDWVGFITPFYTPAFGNSPFDILENSVQTAIIKATNEEEQRGAMSLQRHWSNVITGLVNPSVRSVEWLTSSWSFLLQLLTANSVALTEEQRLSFETLLRSYNLLE